MAAKVISMGLYGAEAFLVEVECDIGRSLPAFDLVGLPDTAVKESRERVRAALKNCGFDYPTGRITVNLAPADIRKEGPLYDLPVLMSVLISSGQLGAGLGFRFSWRAFPLWGAASSKRRTSHVSESETGGASKNLCSRPKRGRRRVGTGAYSISGSESYSADRASERPYSPGSRLSPFSSG